MGAKQAGDGHHAEGSRQAHAKCLKVKEVPAIYPRIHCNDKSTPRRGEAPQRSGLHLPHDMFLRVGKAG